MAELSAMPFSSSLITAEIRVENLSESSTISIPQPSSSVITPQQQQQQQQSINVEESDNNNSPSISKQQTDFNEPSSKRQKLDTSVKAKKLEKLESRLGSVLCCAVCLDLPKTAMYQVSRFYFILTSKFPTSSSTSKSSSPIISKIHFLLCIL